MTVNGPLALVSVRRAPRPCCRRESGERRRRAGDVGAERVAGEQHAERVLGHVPPRRAEDEIELPPEDARADARAAVDRRDLHELRVAGGVGAEGRDPRGPRPRRGGEPLELRRVAIEHGDAAGLEPGEDLGLGVGDSFERAEMLDVHRRDRRHQRDMRPRHGDQRRDLAGVVHADLDHCEGGAGGQARQRQRHAPVIVVGGRGSMGRSEATERDPQHFLGAGLADRAGDGDDAGLRARPGGAPKPLHSSAKCRRRRRSARARRGLRRATWR